MKRYTVLCNSISAANGDVLTKGNNYPESYFLHLADNIANKHVELYIELTKVEEQATAPTPAPQISPKDPAKAN